MSSNIPTSPAFGVFISQLIRYARACFSYGCFILRATRLSNKLLEQGYVKERLKSSLRKFYGRYGDLIKQYEVSLSQMLNDILWPDHIQWQPPTDQTLYRIRPLTEIWVVSIEHLRRVWHADRGHLLLRTPGPVPLGLAYVLRVETNPFPNLRYFTGLCSSNIPRYFLDFASEGSPTLTALKSLLEEIFKMIPWSRCSADATSAKCKVNVDSYNSCSFFNGREYSLVRIWWRPSCKFMNGRSPSKETSCISGLL